MELGRGAADICSSTRWIWGSSSGIAPEPSQLTDGQAALGADRGGDPLRDRLAGEADLAVQQGRLAVRDVPVGQADAEHAGGAEGSAVAERLEDAGAEAA